MTPGVFLFEVHPSPPASWYSVKHVSFSQPDTATVDVFECENVNMIFKKIEAPNKFELRKCNREFFLIHLLSVIGNRLFLS